MGNCCANFAKPGGRRSKKPPSISASQISRCASTRPETQRSPGRTPRNLPPTTGCDLRSWSSLLSSDVRRQLRPRKRLRLQSVRGKRLSKLARNLPSSTPPRTLWVEPAGRGPDRPQQLSQHVYFVLVHGPRLLQEAQRSAVPLAVSPPGGDFGPCRTPLAPLARSSNLPTASDGSTVGKTSEGTSPQCPVPRISVVLLPQAASAG